MPLLYRLCNLCFSARTQSNRVTECFISSVIMQQSRSQTWDSTCTNIWSAEWNIVNELDTGFSKLWTSPLTTTPTDYCETTHSWISGIFLLARLYRIHVGVFMHRGVSSTSRVNDIRLAKFILIYRGLTEFSETCTLNGADLYLDSLILNTQHGRMPCHQDIAKLEGIDNVPDSPVDLTLDADVPPKQEINTDVKPVVKRENRKDTQVISSMSVLHTQPKNKLKTLLYRKSLQLLLKAKAEIKTKSEHKEKTDRITEHIQNVSIDPAMVAKRARNRRTSMISSNCELCGELCR